MRKLNNKGAAQIVALGVGAALLIVGHFQYKAGKWGPNGTEAVKNCPGTHVNDNCEHMRIEDL